MANEYILTNQVKFHEYSQSPQKFTHSGRDYYFLGSLVHLHFKLFTVLQGSMVHRMDERPKF